MKNMFGKKTVLIVAIGCAIVVSGVMVYTADNLYLSSKNLVTANIPSRLFSNSQSSFLVLAHDIEGVPSDEKVTVDVILGGETFHLYEGKMDDGGYVKPLFTVPNITGMGELVIRVGDEKIKEDISIVDTHRILLSTDKPLYQPGQTIHIRMLTYENIDPVASDDMVELSIADPEGNIMAKEFLQPDNEYGITEYDFFLSDQLPLGDYEITARVGGEEVQVVVMVGRYVLPKFSIEVEDMKPWYLINESISGVVSCRYFFGKDVEGTVQINASTYLGTWVNVSGVEGELTQGEFKFTLPPINYAVALPVWNRNGVIQLQISVKDTGGHMENETHIIPLANNSLVITTLGDNNIIDTISNYYVIVRDPCGVAMDNAQVMVSVDGKNLTSKMTNERGIAHFSFLFTNQTTLRLDVIKNDVRIVSKHELTGSKGIKVIPNKENYLVGDKVQCEVYYTGNSTTDWVYYDMIANGFVTTTGRLSLSEGKGNFSIIATPDMMPLTQIRAYKIQPDLNVTRDTAVIGVVSVDTLNVHVYTTQEEYEPHENITLQFKVDDGEHPIVAAMCINIVDKSVFEVSQRFIGLEKLYFELEEEFITPAYEIHEYVFTNTTRILPLEETPDLVDQNSFKTEDNMVFSNPDKYLADAQLFKEKSIFFYWMILLIAFIVCAIVLTTYFAGKVFGKTKMFATLAALGLCVCGVGMFMVMNQALISYTEDGTVGDIPPADRNEWADDKFFVNITNQWLEDAPVKDSILAGTGTQDTAPERVRHFFPETWYWTPFIITDEEGKANITLVTPDSITSWNIEAIASTMDAQIGVGTQEIQVFKKFFVEPDIPVAAIRGDEFPLNILVYNYGNTTSTATVEIEQDEWYDLLSRNKQSLTLPPNSVTSVSFTIRPVSVGNHNITITALSNNDSDAITKQIQIDPDGKAITQIENGELRNNQTVTHIIPLSSKRIPNSENAFIKIQGGMESVILDGAEGFLNFVSGCGEQSMSLLAIDILAYQNLLKKEGITTDQLFESETMVTQGIQHEFLYLVRDKDGRGIVWFPHEENPHPWLTSWGLLTFQDAKNTGFTIDDKIIQDMQNWLINKQDSDGSYTFPEWGLYETTNPILKMKKVATTAYITRALLYSGYESDGHIKKSLEYITENINDHWNDPYTLALALIVLEDAHGEKNLRDKIYSQLLLLRNEDNETVYWETENNMYSNTETVRFGGMSTYTIETTAYAIMALQKHGGSDGILKGAVSYLLNHRNQMGGFSSTQDTVVALQALNGQGTNEIKDIQINIYANNIPVAIVNLTEENKDVTHLIDLRPYLTDVVSIEITAQGMGSILYQIFSEQYLPWDLVPLEKPRELIINVIYDSTSIKVSDMLWAHVDLMYNGSAKNARMVLIDLRAPVGFSFVSTDFSALLDNDTIDNFEIRGRQAVIYIENLTQGEWIHFDYQLEANQPIKGTIQGVKAYDMYNPSITAETPPVDIISSP